MKRTLTCVNYTGNVRPGLSSERIHKDIELPLAGCRESSIPREIIVMLIARSWIQGARRCRQRTSVRLSSHNDGISMLIRASTEAFTHDPVWFIMAALLLPAASCREAAILKENIVIFVARSWI